MPESQWIQVSLPDAVLETRVFGSGDPVILIQTAVTADEFLPLAAHISPASHQVILFHRRGYGSSSPVTGAGSIERDARDCKHLLDALGIQKVHVFGGSYSAAVALQLAALVPDTVHSLCLVEPPPVHTSRANEFLAANAQLADYYRLHGPAVAIDYFLTHLMGPAWRSDLAQYLPNAATHIERDAETFLATDIPALLAWRFGAEEAGKITQPVLYVGGADSGPWFAEVRELLLGWLPQAQDIVLTGADHSLALTHATQLGAALTTFIGRHPIRPTAAPGRILDAGQ